MATRTRGSRLSDTNSLVAVPSDGMSSHSIHTRKVENGYMICESSSDPNTGQYRSTERFSATAPRIIPGRVAYGKVSSDGDLGDAVKYLDK
jgi:hypothetical protein